MYYICSAVKDRRTALIVAAILTITEKFGFPVNIAVKSGPETYIVIAKYDALGSLARANLA